MYMTKNDTIWNSNKELSRKFTTPLPDKKFLDSISKDSVVLDLGCGYGRVLKYLEENGFKNIIGVDISKKLINDASKVCHNSKLEVGSFEKIPCKNKSIDIIIFMAVICNCVTKEQESKMIKEIDRVLKNNGLIFIECFMLDLSIEKIPSYLKGWINTGKMGAFNTNMGLTLRHRTKKQIIRLFKNFKLESFEETKFTTWSGLEHKGGKLLFKKCQ